jgi:hypothetical protein
MSIKMFKAVAVVLMLLALAWVVGAVRATTRSADIQGPSALAVLPDHSVWLSVDEALWHMNEGGNRIALVNGAMLGIGRIGNLILHPNGQLVAQVRNDPTLYFLDAETAATQSRLVPQWQPDLVQHGSDAINYAFHDDGRVAIATGGGHAVALFDAQGSFLARTKPDLYRFTNGLWWVGDTLWTTDTNHQELVELDGNTLAERSRVALSRSCGGYQFLGYAAPSHGKPSEWANSAPLVTLVRFANGMTKGRASDIFPDGTQLDFPVSGIVEPRDIRWRGNELLLVDGASFAIKRYSEDRAAIDDFGDMQVQAELTGLLSQRNRLENQYKLYLGGAILFFLIGFGFALRAQSLEKRQALAALNIDLSQLGTPILSPKARLVGMWKILWPMFLTVGASVFVLLYLPHLSQSLNRLTLLLFTILLFPLAIFLIRRSFKRFANHPETEGVFNQHAVQFLQTDANFWRSCQPGELPQETLALMVNFGYRLIVLTNRRLLVFVANLTDRTLAQQYRLEDVLCLRLLEKQEMTWFQKLQKIFNPFGEVIGFEFRDGTSLSGFTISGRTAQRIAERLASATSVATINEPFDSQPAAQAESPVPVARSDKALFQTIASFFIPGLGQWIQRRSGTALMFFVVWLIILWGAVLIGLTLWNSMSDVSWARILSTSIYYLLVCSLSAWEAWRMRERK